jgi:hypothetical protein
MHVLLVPALISSSPGVEPREFCYSPETLRTSTAVCAYILHMCLLLGAIRRESNSKPVPNLVLPFKQSNRRERIHSVQVDKFTTFSILAEDAYVGSTYILCMLSGSKNLHIGN